MKWEDLNAELNRSYEAKFQTNLISNKQCLKSKYAFSVFCTFKTSSRKICGFKFLWNRFVDEPRHQGVIMVPAMLRSEDPSMFNWHNYHDTATFSGTKSINLTPPLHSHHNRN